MQAALRAHPQARNYRVGLKPKQIIIYEHVGPDLMELVTDLANDLGISARLGGDIAQRMQENERIHGQFTPVMRFILTDSEKRHFKAQRMCYLGRANQWRGVAFDRSLAELASKLIPALGTDEFFELSQFA